MILKNIGTIAYYTFKELFKSKILLNVFFIGIGMMVVTYVATEFTYGVPGRVALDFGMGMLSISTIGISLFLGVGLLSKEIDSRTVYMIISRPVPRFAFIVGKIIGLLGIQLLNVLILTAMTILSTSLLGGSLDSVIPWVILFIFIESVLVLLVVVLTSLLANNILSVLFSMLILLMGHAVKETQDLNFVKLRPGLKSVLEVYHFILPAFHKLNLKEFVIYEKSLPLSYLLPNLAYGITYSMALMIFIIVIFNKKNLD